MLCLWNAPIHIYKDGKLFCRTLNCYSAHNHDEFGRREYDRSRLAMIRRNMLYFSSAERLGDVKKRGKIVRVNLDTFEEVVLDKLADNIADFLVDENQTITYLTSQGELRQENPDNSSIPKTCVNLKNSITDASFAFQSFCKISASKYLAAAYHGPAAGNMFQLATLRPGLSKVEPSSLLVAMPTSSRPPPVSCFDRRHHLILAGRICTLLVLLRCACWTKIHRTR